MNASHNKHWYYAVYKKKKSTNKHLKQIIVSTKSIQEKTTNYILSVHNQSCKMLQSLKMSLESAGLCHLNPVGRDPVISVERLLFLVTQVSDTSVTGRSFSVSVLPGRAHHLLLLLEEDARGGQLSSPPPAPPPARLPPHQDADGLHSCQHSLTPALQRVLYVPLCLEEEM